MVNFDRVGSGPALLLVHGITDSRRAWEPLLPALACTHDVISVDLRGHGQSPSEPPYDMMTLAADLHEAVTSAGFPSPVLIGHSLGGAIASAYAAIYGCRGVINIDQPLALATFQEALRPFEPLLRGSEEEFQRAIDMIFTAMRGRLDDAGWERLQSLRRANRNVVLGIWETVLDTPSAELDQSVSMLASAIMSPYLSLHGSDPGSGYEDWLRSRVPSCTVEIWEGLGHYPHLVEADRFVERVDRFEFSLANS